MDDLISRSQLLEEVEKYKFGAISNDTERDYIKSTILDFITHKQAAYSIDKVVEELEERQKEYLSGFGVHNNDEMYGVACGLGDAIEIVKHGGVADDACERKKCSSGSVDFYVYSSKCLTKNIKEIGTTTHIIDDWKYCPYCGKKIKIVGD